MTPEPVIRFCLLPLMTKSRWPPAVRTCGKPGLFFGSLSDIGPACRDPNDDHVIATALAVKADCIVTGDKDLLALGQFGTVRILTARAFLTELTGGG